MEDTKREILAKVAAGTLNPQEAAVELERLGADNHAPSEPVTTATAAAGDVTRVRVFAGWGSLTVVGDESVREAVADGPHSAIREGDAYVIKSLDDEDPGFGFSFGSARIGYRHPKLVVRMNPRLRLEAEVQAGSLTVRGIRAPIKVEVQAGSARLEDFTFPIDLDVQAGSVKGYGRLTEGSSRISCQAGSVKLDLDPSSSVKIKAKTSLGRISLPGTAVVAGLGGGGSEAQLGEGAATLDIVAELGSVQVGSGR
jgi:hypothetical protein